MLHSAWCIVLDVQKNVSYYKLHCYHYFYRAETVCLTCTISMFFFFPSLEHSSLKGQGHTITSFCLAFETWIYSCPFFLAIVLAAIATQTVPEGLFDLIPEVTKTWQHIKLWSTADLINFVNLCVPALCQAPCWPLILTALLREHSLTTHPTPHCLSKAPETPCRVSSAFQELWGNILQNYKIHISKYYLRNCSL